MAGVDIGGTKMLVVLVDAADPTVVQLTERVDTPEAPGDLVPGIAAAVRRLGVGVTAVGVGIAGLVDSSGVVRTSPNLPGVDRLDLRAGLHEQLDAPVVVDNDATAAAVAEARLGAGRGRGDVVLVTVGTGIGGGLVSSGHVRRGANGFAGEFGHMILEPGGVLCVCGRRGCWERYASGSALARLGREHAADHDVAVTLHEQDIDGTALVSAARAGLEGAVAVIDLFAGYLGLGIANLAAALDPDVFVLGGGVMEAHDVLLDRVRRAAARELFGADQRPPLDMRVAELGARAGAVGAALLAIDHIRA